MCRDQNWCANPYIQTDVIEPECGAYSEYAVATISLHKRGVLTAHITGDFIAVEWDCELRAWSLWAACNMPSAIAVLLGPHIMSDDPSDTACSMIAEQVMGAVTDGLLDGPSVRVPLDGAELRVELVVAYPQDAEGDMGMDVDAAEASCGWWVDG